MEISPIWFDNNKVWAHNYFSMPSVKADWIPINSGEMRKIKVYYPAKPELFLESKYGPGLKKPDPGFSYNRSHVNSRTLKYMESAFITPEEFRQMALLIERDGKPETGRLISIAAVELYPHSSLDIESD